MLIDTSPHLLPHEKQTTHSFDESIPAVFLSAISNLKTDQFYKEMKDAVYHISLYRRIDNEEVKKNVDSALKAVKNSLKPLLNLLPKHPDLLLTEKLGQDLKNHEHFKDQYLKLIVPDNLTKPWITRFNAFEHLMDLDECIKSRFYEECHSEINTDVETVYSMFRLFFWNEFTPQLFNFQFFDDNNHDFIRTFNVVHEGFKFILSIDFLRDSRKNPNNNISNSIPSIQHAKCEFKSDCIIA